MVRPLLPRFGRRTAVRILAVTAAASAALVTGAASSSAAPVHRQPPVKTGSNYLALGDSVSFGYRESANLPYPNYSDAKSFVGYPEYVATALGLKVANASCAGETSSSFVTSNVVSNGCEANPVTHAPGYRTFFPLHVKYSGTQLSYAIHYLKTHRNTRLVSLMIGANDGFVCRKVTTDKCAKELPKVLKQVKANVRIILNGIRYQAHYRGQIVILNYYSLDYTDPAQVAQSKLLNAAQDSGARPYNVSIADGYGIFKAAAAQVGGNTCTAGLITTLTPAPAPPASPCGIHPSIGGQSLLAVAVEKVIKH